MKRILVIGMSDNLGGPETIIMNYYRNIDRDKIQFDFLYNTKDIAYKDEIINLGGNIYKITPRRESLKKYKKEINSFFKEHASKYDGVWINLCILSNIDWLKYAKKYGIKKIILHSHNSKNMENLPKLILHKLHKLVIRKYVTDYWACSEEAGRWFYSKSIMRSEKYRIVNNAIDIYEYKFNEQIRNECRKKLNVYDKLVIGNIGRFHFQKNHDFIVDIFKNIHEIRKDACLILIGVGKDEERIKNKVKKYGIEKNVMFLGKRDDVTKLLQAMDVFLFPSLFEGLPVVLIEAQANGIDTYVSKESVPTEIKMSNNLYFLSLKQSAEEWADEILKKETHERNDNCEIIKQNGFDIKTEAKKMQNFFEDIK